MKFTIKYVSNLDPHGISYRLCRNPAYGGVSTGIPGTVGVKIKKNRKTRTRAAILDSVRQEGFRNPILAYTSSEGTFLSFGGGRLDAAQALDRPLPAIVVCYDGSFEDCRDVGPDNYEEFFTDVPALFEFTDYGIDTHYGLERNRNNDFDPAGVEWAMAEDEYMEAVLDESDWLTSVS